MSETFLSDAQKEEIRIDLVSKHQVLLNEVEELNKDMREVQPAGPDDADKAAAIEERNSMLAKVNHKTLTINAIEKTLNNFEDFGYCTDCGDDIEVKRILNNPTVTRCIGCQEIHELKKKQSSI